MTKHQNRLRYQTNTEDGSSGSPVFNREWRVVALHHAHLSEFGIVAPIGRRGIDQLLAIVADEEDTRVPVDARLCLQMLAA